MTRRNFLTTGAEAGFGLFLGSKGLEAFGKERGRPNVVVILADDLGYGDVGCYGCTDIKTPNIDGLAKAGVRFTNYYAAPVCTPTRCAFMTGRYQQRVKEMEWAIYPGVKRLGLPPTETTIATMLKRNGYTTGLFGKWHLGYKKEYGPNSHGFDEFFGFLSGNINYFTHKEINGEPDLYENTKPVEVEGYMTDLITERSLRFLDRHHGEPFFLEVSYNAPHWPIQGPDDANKVIDESNWRTCERETYIKMVERMDRGIGELLERLDKYNLASNTVVIFASDNGGDRASRNDPFSGRKTTLWEGGIRCACIIRFPGIIRAGKVMDQPSIVMDLSATILAGTGTKPPVGRTLDGEDLMPLILGKAKPRPRTFFWRSKTQD
ncbi:sulfatase-like hydrolase/transferase, partial [bacterium]|nr:sulfatase-like hydrolase/transferase [bacterium]